MEQVLDAQHTGYQQMNYAGFGPRLAAALIDGLIIAAVIFTLMFVSIMVFGEGESLLAITYAVLIIAAILYYPLMESSSYQATVGKNVMKLIVVSEQGQRISFLNALGRFFAKYLSQLILYIGYLMILWDDRKQGLHDKLAKTYVVHRETAY